MGLALGKRRHLDIEIHLWRAEEADEGLAGGFGEADG